VRPVLVLSAPGVVETYPQLDAVRRELAPELEDQFRDAGFELLGWGDAGQIRLFSTQRIRRPSDLRRARPWVWRDNPVFVEFLRSAGVRGVPLSLPEVRPGMQTGRIDTFPSSALAAVGLQWFTSARYVSAQASGAVVGALVMRKDVYDRLPADVKQAFADESARSSRRLARAVRRADERAYRALLSRGLTAVDTEPHRAEWLEVARRTRERLNGRVWPEALMARVERIAARAR
jgi:TRAP-type C4-dicarboxylate transport system substrate-binding protein